jgi:hypothetical protein
MGPQLILRDSGRHTHTRSAGWWRHPPPLRSAFGVVDLDWLGLWAGCERPSVSRRCDVVTVSTSDLILDTNGCETPHALAIRPFRRISTTGCTAISDRLMHSRTIRSIISRRFLRMADHRGSSNRAGEPAMTTPPPGHAVQAPGIRPPRPWATGPGGSPHRCGSPPTPRR